MLLGVCELWGRVLVQKYQETVPFREHHVSLASSRASLSEAICMLPFFLVIYYILLT